MPFMLAVDENEVCVCMYVYVLVWTGGRGALAPTSSTYPYSKSSVGGVVFKADGRASAAPKPGRIIMDRRPCFQGRKTALVLGSATLFLGVGKWTSFFRSSNRDSYCGVGKRTHFWCRKTEPLGSEIGTSFGVGKRNRF